MINKGSDLQEKVLVVHVFGCYNANAFVSNITINCFKLSVTTPSGVNTSYYT